MKIIQKTLLPSWIAVLFLFFCLNTTYAQPSLSVCGTYSVVGSSCAGACGTGLIEHQVGPLCSSLIKNLCVRTESSSLCPSHRAIAKIYVGGVLTAVGDITTAGSSISFSATCGSKVKVVVTPVLRNKNIQCVWLGNVNFTLREQ